MTALASKRQKLEQKTLSSISSDNGGMQHWVNGLHVTMCCIDPGQVSCHKHCHAHARQIVTQIGRNDP